MKYFTTAKTLEDAKTLYKTLAMKNHPDKGGETAIMQEINAEFEQIFQILKHTAKANSESVNKESATEYKKSFYSENGWEGERFDPNLRVKEIGSIMREYVKYVYPTFKFSIRSTYNTITIDIMEAPVNLFINPEDAPKTDRDGFDTNYALTFERGCKSVNHYYIKDDFLITDYAKSIFTDIHQMLISYNYDDSDSMTDYFDTNFYETLGIGRWDRPFQVVTKTARVGGKENKSAKRIA